MSLMYYLKHREEPTVSSANVSSDAVGFLTSDSEVVSDGNVLG